MVSVTSASRYIMSASHDHSRYQNRSSMYIRGRTLFVAFRCYQSKDSQIVSLHIQNRPDLKMQFDVIHVRLIKFIFSMVVLSDVRPLYAHTF